MNSSPKTSCSYIKLAPRRRVERCSPYNSFTVNLGLSRCYRCPCQKAWVVCWHFMAFLFEGAFTLQSLCLKNYWCFICSLSERCALKQPHINAVFISGLLFFPPSSPFNHLCSNNFFVAGCLSKLKVTWGFSACFQWGTCSSLEKFQIPSFCGVPVLIGLFPGYLRRDSLNLACDLDLGL